MKDCRVSTEIIESPEFYETLRNEVSSCMTLVAVCDEGSLFYWDDFVEVMMVVGADYVGLSYACAGDAEGAVRLIRECTEAVREPAKIRRLAELFCYFASSDVETGRVRLHNFRSGDWMGIYPRAKRSALRRLYSRLPHGWPESYRSVIEALNRGRGEDDSLASRHDRLTTRLNHILNTTRFADTAATFDAQYSRPIPLEASTLSPFHFPVETHNLSIAEICINRRCNVDIAAANRYLSECGVKVDSANGVAQTRSIRIELPSYGLAALAFLVEKLPDVTRGGRAFFSRGFQLLPELDFDYEQLIDEPGYHQVGSGIVVLKVLFEGMLAFGGDLFPSRAMRTPFGELGDFYHGVMCTALEIQDRVILSLVGQDSGNWIR